MPRPAACAVIAILAFSPPALSAPVPTPELSHIRQLHSPGGLAYVMTARLRPTRTIVGLAILCAPSTPTGIEITAYFGPFPPSPRPLQVAVRLPDRTVLRFGPVFAADARSGFHSPTIAEPSEARKFLRAALLPGSLVSNGYVSFRNRVGPNKNRSILDALLNCIAR